MTKTAKSLMKMLSPNRQISLAHLYEELLNDFDMHSQYNVLWMCLKQSRAQFHMFSQSQSKCPGSRSQKSCVKYVIFYHYTVFLNKYFFLRARRISLLTHKLREL